MNTAVGKLLEVDRQARQILDEAKAYYEKTAEEIDRERERIRTQYTRRAETHIAELRVSEALAVDEAISKMDAEKAGIIAHMEEIYESSRREWEDAMFKACVKLVSFGD